MTTSSGRVRLAVVGASGRMGQAVVRLAHEGGNYQVVAAVGTVGVGRDAGELAGVGPIGVAVAPDVAALATTQVDLVIDFSSPAGTALAAGWAASSGASFVSGTTGLDDAASAALVLASERVAVLWEPNMSVGVHVLGELVRRAVAQLGPEFDIEIVEAHHRLKQDAPSGTALRLAEIAQATRAGAHANQSPLVHGRSGRPGARSAAEIGIHAVRGGDVIGDHTVSFLGAGERIEITHRATNRELFAHGALRAGAWLVGKPCGRYRLADVLA